MENELFKVVREKYGAKLDSIIKEKVSVVCGDITRDCLGLETSILEEVFGQVDIIINSAATTNFDERYDIALGINTVGAANVLSFAKKCRKLRTLLHVSTAYVCGKNEGLIPETPLKMGEALNMTPGLNIEMEKKIVDDNLRSLHSAPENHIKSMMRELGLQRARKYGWPNTYTFTKAMGEMMLEQFKENIPLIIIRPTIVTSTFKQPFPGWTEGVSYLGGRRGYVDMVVNAMMVSIATHVYKTTPMIYHVGSSASNPISYLRIRDINTRFFIENPWMSRDGKPVIVTRGTQLPTKLAIQIYINLNYLIPIKILGVVNAASFGYFDRTYIDRSRKVKFLMRMFDLFSPYMFFSIVFDDINMEKLKSSVNEMCGDIENEIFNFDPKSINWDDYLMHTHIPGLVKYSFKR
ncbi:fatty acyl-CoA reductase 3-like [Salvia miltiorrhiza]|uniref:fatty acyl-CoA reductase 3-like n=1 Tax=Salvia miltiorrhiza TaxID=226208 RepID=UPI0025AB8910|nr:fatty acyl-CoA reductase 3-like [Salvia miltiorrhiza]